MRGWLLELCARELDKQAQCGCACAPQRSLRASAQPARSELSEREAQHFYIAKVEQLAQLSEHFEVVRQQAHGYACCAALCCR
jgi:alpha/beta superfamily hydrolase